MNEIVMAVIEPYIWEAIGGIIAIATAAVVGPVRKFFNLKADEALAGRIHSAAMTGVKAAMSDKRTEEQIVAAALAYVKTLGAPDSVAALKVRPEALEHLVLSKLRDVRTSGGRS